MKRTFALLLSALLIVFITACDQKNRKAMNETPSQTTAPPAQTEAKDEAAVTDLVKEFGGKLQEVSLLAPKEIVHESMRKSYGEYVSEELLDKWQSDPNNAPGRLTSSPWPDRIEIQSLERAEDGSYLVKGEIVEITSTEQPGTGAASRQSVTLIVEYIDGRWVITDAVLGGYLTDDGVVYQDDIYGFNLALPDGWKGYEVVPGKWEGLAMNGDQGEQIAQEGPMLSVRHPLWTEDVPRQDIPVMVFTLAQWDSLQKEEFHIGAAPMGPSELARNSKYVFALPARYNYAFPEGFEEVDAILKNNAFEANENIR